MSLLNKLFTFWVRKNRLEKVFGRIIFLGWKQFGEHLRKILRSANRGNNVTENKC